MIAVFNEDLFSGECQLSNIIQRTSRRVKGRRSKTSRGRRSRRIEGRKNTK